jgi:molybdopterin synthase catalytic subunit
MVVTTRLEHHALEPDAELRALLAASHGDGAVVSFVGVARPSTRAGAAISGLYLDHFPGVTEASLETIAREACERFPISHAHVVHRCGFVPANEPIVFAAAASAHRRAAFEAADYLMDRLKTDAAFWKREDSEGGHVWIEPTEQDRADRQRWDR